MRSADRKRFADALAATFAVYGHTLTPDVIRIWWNVLDGYRLDAVLSALSYHVGDHEGHGYRLPTPADVRKHLEVTLPALAAADAREPIERQRAENRDILEKLCLLQNDVRLGIKKEEDTRAANLELAELLREGEEKLAHLRHLAAPAIREDTGEASPTRRWLPPFLRRGIALLTGKTT